MLSSKKCAYQMKPEEVGRNYAKEAGDEEDVLDIPYYTSHNLPSIMLENEELPPEYFELESARASPLPSYDDVMYCDQLNRSFQNLISAR
ncbi:unnamed protein product [Caenorhabditis angaria]|uniref:Uncharacterized protein n=1 Tax=Caenorhabditis angaria TaxID=860376 RepID=A0A9P1J005_9PELO|nr:unnamed protein product [Caenorhabditis angaria]